MKQKKTKSKGRFVERSRSKRKGPRSHPAAVAPQPVEQPREPVHTEITLSYRWVPCWWRFDGGYYEVFAGCQSGSNRWCKVPARLSKAQASAVERAGGIFGEPEGANA